jgi:hypothetical protein
MYRIQYFASSTESLRKSIVNQWNALFVFRDTATEFSLLRNKKKNVTTASTTSQKMGKAVTQFFKMDSIYDTTLLLQYASSHTGSVLSKL